MRRHSIRGSIGCGVAIVGLLLGFCVAESSGQGNKQKSIQEVVAGWKAQPEFQAKIEGMRGGSIFVKNFANEVITIQVWPQILKSVSVKGSAEISAVKAGFGMRFAGKVDEAGMVAEKVSEFYLVPADFLTEFNLNEDAEIVGKITVFDPKNNTVKIAINGVKKEMKGEKEIITKKVKLATVTLAENPKISVELKDLALAHLKDTISVAGKIARDNANKEIANVIVAETIVVDLSEPLSFGKRRTAPAEPAKGEKIDPFAEAGKQAGGDAKKEEMKKEEAKKEAEKKAAK